MDEAAAEIRQPRGIEFVSTLERLSERFGTDDIARLLSIPSADVATLVMHRRNVEAHLMDRAFALDEVLVRALRVFQPRTAIDWLYGNEPFLDHARPIDVFNSRGSAPLIDALEGIDAGGYA